MAEKIKPASSISPQGSKMSGFSGNTRKGQAAGITAVETVSDTGARSKEDTVCMGRTGREAEEIEIRGLLNAVEGNNLKFIEAISGDEESGNSCVVPRLSGMTVSEAAARLKDAGLKVSKVTRQYSFLKSDLVVSQIPGAGESVDRGYGVHIITG